MQHHFVQVAIDVRNRNGIPTGEGEPGIDVGAHRGRHRVDRRIVAADHRHRERGDRSGTLTVLHPVAEGLGRGGARCQSLHRGAGFVDGVGVRAIRTDGQGSIAAGNRGRAGDRGPRRSGATRLGLGNRLGIAGIDIRIVTQDVVPARNELPRSDRDRIAVGDRCVVGAVDGDDQIGP